MQDYYLYYFHLGYVHTVGSYVNIYLAQIMWNLIFSVQIWTTLIRDPKSDTDIFCFFVFVNKCIRIPAAFTLLA